MSDRLRETEEWLKAVMESISEIAPTTLGLTVSPPTPKKEAPPADLSGGHIALSCEKGRWRVGIVSSPTGCQHLAKALLGMESGDEDLPEADMADAVSEVTNILAGALKRRMSMTEGHVQLSLPKYGQTKPLDAVPEDDKSFASALIGSVPVELVVAREK
jgi:hypothetical protein